MCRILYVEDSFENFELLSFILNDADRGYQLEWATSADEAIERISAGPFDAYILDKWIPGMDGADLCRWIRQTGSTSPVIFFSGAVRDVDKATAYQAGANKYLEKPDDLFEVETAVKQELGLSGGESAKS